MLCSLLFSLTKVQARCVLPLVAAGAMGYLVRASAILLRSLVHHKTKRQFKKIKISTKPQPASSQHYLGLILQCTGEFDHICFFQYMYVPLTFDLDQVSE